jgi:hypothetical protein
LIGKRAEHMRIQFLSQQSKEHGKVLASVGGAA